MATSNIDPRRPHFVLLAQGLRDVGEARVLNDRGRSRITVGMVMALQSIADDKDLYNAFIRACQGIHADRREATEAFAAGWAFFRDNVYDVREDAGIKKPELVKFDKLMADDESGEKFDANERAKINAPIGARAQALMFGASVAVQFDAAGVDWSTVQVNKHGDSIVTDEANMTRLFANLKKDKSIKNWQLKDYPIGTFGNFRFTALAEEGNNVLRRRNIKKTVARKTADTTAMRDRLATVAKEITDADAKSYDAEADNNVALAAFVSIANALNDGTLKHVRFTKDEYTTIMEIVEKAKARAATANGTKPTGVHSPVTSKAA